MSQDQQPIEKPEGDRRHHEQVHGGDAVGMISDKSLPALRWGSPGSRHILGHARLPDIDAKLEKLAVDAWRTPEEVCSAHLPDQLANLQRHFWSSCTSSRFPA